jgi:hypothetical protein
MSATLLLKKDPCDPKPCVSMVEAASTDLDPSLSHLRKLRKKNFHRKKVRFSSKSGRHLDFYGTEWIGISMSGVIRYWDKRSLDQHNILSYRVKTPNVWCLKPLTYFGMSGVHLCAFFEPSFVNSTFCLNDRLSDFLAKLIASLSHSKSWEVHDGPWFLSAGPLPSVLLLKGMSGEILGGSKVVSIDRSPFKLPTLCSRFYFIRPPSWNSRKTIQRKIIQIY